MVDLAEAILTTSPFTAIFHIQLTMGLPVGLAVKAVERVVALLSSTLQILSMTDSLKPVEVQDPQEMVVAAGEAYK